MVGMSTAKDYSVSTKSAPYV